MLAVSRTGLAVILPYECGRARRIQEPDEIFKYGVDGVSDLFGAVRGGKMFCFEIKTGNAKQSTEQKNFERTCKRFGIHYEVIRAESEAVRTIKRLAS